MTNWHLVAPPFDWFSRKTLQESELSLRNTDKYVRYVIVGKHKVCIHVEPMCTSNSTHCTSIGMCVISSSIKVQLICSQVYKTLHHTVVLQRNIRNDEIRHVDTLSQFNTLLCQRWVFQAGIIACLIEELCTIYSAIQIHKRFKLTINTRLDGNFDEAFSSCQSVLVVETGMSFTYTGRYVATCLKT